MKKQLRGLIAVLLVTAVLCAIVVPVAAAAPSYPDLPNASAYIHNVYAEGNGGSRSASVYFCITATGKMTSVGGTLIMLYDYNGDFVASKSYVYYPNMMGSNKTYHSDTETFSGLSAGTYFARVYFKAANSSGYDTTSYTTDYFYVSN